jgi:hypothetical protein
MCKSVFPSPLKQFRDLSSPYLPLHSTYWSPFDSKVMLYVTLLSATLVWCGSLLTVKGCSTQYIHVRVYICLHSCAMYYGSYVYSWFHGHSTEPCIEHSHCTEHHIKHSHSTEPRHSTEPHIEHNHSTKPCTEPLWVVLVNDSI